MPIHMYKSWKWFQYQILCNTFRMATLWCLICLQFIWSFTFAQSGVRNQAVLDLFTKSYKGDGTYYGDIVEGSCQIAAPLPPAATNSKITALVALNRPQYLNSLVCGMCIKVTGSGTGHGSDPITGVHIVYVKDLCPVCHEGDVDFALNGDGRWDIDIQAVQCPVGSTSIQYAFQGSNPWYIKLQIRNARIPITGVEIQKNGGWVTPTHSPDGYWILSGGGAMPDGPFRVRLTAANGQVLEDSVPRIDNDNILEGINKVQVAFDPSLPDA
ncbi:expansin-YoaJ-like [Physella acuta]|uniref:expansin-YoaJ-like n=1 Tax=Physella acuta TaxID=109671 RepID=UPI0027DB83FA|nr:expansin-YoaJ-like [Physella acuta]